MGMAREKDADDVEVVEEETGPRSFAVFVDQLADGALNLDASVELHRLGQALMARVNAGERKAKGELDVKLKFEIDASGAVRISYALKRKDPPIPTTPGICWQTDGGNFVMSNPRQLSLGIREVASPKRDARDVGRGAPPKEV